jgi:hypothetical protein
MTGTSTHFGVRIETWKFNFESSKFRAKVDTKAFKALSRIGAILMRSARSKIKRRVVTEGMMARYRAASARGDKAAARRILNTIERRQTTVSQPGEPPIAHVPDHPVASIRAIYFTVVNRLVMVGPVKANQVTFRNSNRSTVPELLEKGGTSLIFEERVKYGNGRFGTWYRRDMRRNAKDWKEYRTRNAKYQPRPFMAPTLRDNQDKIRSVISSVFRAA